jgi:hypothetical protein
MTVEKTATSTAPADTSAAAPPAATQTEGADAAASEDLLGEVKPDASETAAKEGEKVDAQKDEGDDLLEGKVAEEAKDETSAAPEDYTFTPPEGFELDEQLATAFKPVAKELNLSQDQAQGLVEKFAPQMLARFGEQQAEAWKNVQKEWAGEFKNDAEYGGKNLEASLASIATARDYFGAEFTAAIKLIGGNNNPAILKGLAKVGKALAEDAPGFGKPVTAEKSALQKLYPNDPPKQQQGE